MRACFPIESSSLHQISLHQIKTHHIFTNLLGNC